jgi:pimeloyl-ACP methyl ester carboxylesterase
MESSFAEICIDGRVQWLEYAWLDGAQRGAPLMIFLHEGLGSVAMWRDFPRKLCAATGTRGLMYSRYGHGRSTPRPATEKWPVGFMHVQALEVLPALLAQLGIEDAPWLFGHSDGGSIALLYAAAFPDRIAGLIVVAPHVFVEDVSISSIDKARNAYATTDMRHKLARYHADPDSAFYGWNDVWLDPAFRVWNIVDCLQRIRCPVLAVQGEDDEYGTIAQVHSIGQHVGHARVLEIPACGHSPHRDQPAMLTGAVVAFLNEHRQVPARIPVAART